MSGNAWLLLAAARDSQVPAAVDRKTWPAGSCGGVVGVCQSRMRDCSQSALKSGSAPRVRPLVATLAISGVCNDAPLAMQSIQALMNNLERSPQWQASSGLRQVLAIWPQLVGAAVAQHSQPTKIYREVLQVSVSSAAWAQTLTFERTRIRQKLHHKLPLLATKIRDLRFASAEWRRLTQRSQPLAVNSLTHHPSWAALNPDLSPLPPATAHDAFQKWAERKQAQLANQSQCPCCHSPCPSQELQRWGVCAICQAHQWHTLQSQDRQEAKHKKNI